MHVHTNDAVISQSNSIANNKIAILLLHTYKARRLPLQLNKSIYDTVMVITCYVHRGKGFK